MTMPEIKPPGYCKDCAWWKPDTKAMDTVHEDLIRAVDINHDPQAYGKCRATYKGPDEKDLPSSGWGLGGLGAYPCFAKDNNGNFCFSSLFASQEHS